MSELYRQAATENEWAALRSTRTKILAAFFLFSFALCIPSARAQGTLSDYQRAQGLREKFQGLAINIPGQTNWILGTNHFWYRKSVRGGYEFVLVDADSLAKRPAFDHEKLAAALSSASGNKYTAVTLPFAEAPAPAGRGGGGRGPTTGASAFVFSNEERAIDFTLAAFNWKCTLTTYECTKGAPISQGGVAGRGGRGPQDDSLH